MNKKDKGYLIWITGLSGSGKSSIAKKIFPHIKKKLGPSILINGDDLRLILNLKSYTKKSRLKNGIMFSNLFKFFTDQKINIVFAGLGLFHKLRAYNRRNIKNYLEIYIKADIQTIIKKKKKEKIYKKKKNVYGLHLIPELPKKPDIVINNDFKKNTNSLSKLLISSINNFID
jgi:adenylylsulfate kinase|tara:strand:+ start:179 stop:697 length:519 start_codon:yes stop_codon:yes gene_type:complete